MAPAQATRVPLVVLLALAATPDRARAEAAPPPRARLVYAVDPAAAPCPSADELRAAVNARVGREVFGEPATLTIEIALRRDGTAFVATVSLPDAPGEGAARELRSDASCAELVAAAALVASIAVDPESVLRTPPPPLPPPPPPAPPRTWRMLVGGGPRALWGLTPSATAGLALSVAVVGARHALGAEVRGFLPTDTSYAQGAVAVAPLSFAVLPCWLWRALEACAVAQIGALHGAGSGFDHDYTPWKLFAGGGARGAWFRDVGRLRLRASLEGDVLLPRTRFQVGDAAAYTTQGVSLSAGLDALLFF